MTFRLPVQISRVGAICKPVSPDGLVSRLATRKHTIKKLILYQMKQNPSANLLKECKHKISYVPTRYNSSKLYVNHSTIKQNTNKTVKQSSTKLMKDAEGSDYYKEMEKINIGPYFKRRPIKINSKIKNSRIKCNLHTLTKNKKIENYHEEIKVLDEKINTCTKPVISSLEKDIDNILLDTDLKIQNDIWKQSGLDILNNLNSKNSIWKFIYGKRKTIKHEFLQQKLVIKNKKIKNNKEPRIEIEEINATESPEEIIKQTLPYLENKPIPDILEPKNVHADSKLPLKLSTSKIMEQQQSKPSNINVQIDPPFCKQNVIMSTVNNRQLNNPNPEFMEQYSYNNSYYHINAMKDMENYNGIDMKYPKICYNEKSDSYLLHNEIAAVEAKIKETKSTPKIAKIIKPIVTKSSESDKKIKSITVRKLSVKKSTPKTESLKTTNEGIIRQCASNSICVSNLQSAKAANLMELNEAVSEKPNIAKIETPLSKKRDQKSRNKIKSSRLPKTLGEIYGVGKIRFLVEVSKPGQADHKQYLVVIQLPESKRDELSENNSPIPLNVNAEANDDSILSQQDCLSDCVKETNPDQISTSKKNASKVGSMIGLVKMKNKILPLLEINDYKGIEPLSTKISQLIKPKINKKDDDTEWGKTSYLEYRKKLQDKSEDIDEKQKISTFCNSPGYYNKDVHDQLQKIMNSAEYLREQRKLKASVTCKHIRQYSTCSRKNSTTKGLTYKILQKVRHTNRSVDFQQKRNLSCCMCSRCGQCPCICCNPCPCSPCGWYPCNSCRPKCCPKFQLDYCCPRGRWDCSIPVPPCRKIEAPYPSYGESMPMWCKEITECFDYEEHMLQPKNQTSRKIPLMEESIPKVTVVDPALQRKCCLDKWCEPCYPCVDQRICFYPYKVPVDYCCPRYRPHCYCWPERPCYRKPPPYRCFSDEELEFPEVEVTEHDLARKFASDLYRRMGKKCRLPFAPHYSVPCDLRSGEPVPVCNNNPKEACATTCMPPNTYPACCTPVRIPPCEYPHCDTCINCCMPMEGIKKTRCSKKCCDDE